jgi:class 3 adenylate cyclase
MTMGESDSGLLAILFADIVGSTQLYERFGNERAHAAVDGCIGSLKEVTREFGGRVVKTIGDELMAVFPDAEVACLAAIEMQWKVADLAPVDDMRIEIRIGFHHGATMERDGDVFGDSVNVAARVAELAKGGQIITTVQTLDVMPDQVAAAARHLWPIQVKGKTDPIDVFEIMWDASGDATVTLSAQFMPAKIPVRLRLLYRGNEFSVGPDRPAVSIGREGVNELVVDDRKASRVHARIEWRRDKFVIADLSTNGTFLMSETNVEACLRREEHILDGNGTISLGHSHSAGPRNCVEFYCEYYLPASRSIVRSSENAGA